MNDYTLMPFGPYVGEKLANVPPDHLISLYDDNIVYGDLKAYIEDNMDVLRFEIKTKKF